MAEGTPKLLPVPLHKAFLVANTLVWMVFKPLILLAAGPYEALVPEHTRYAFFQLYMDLRTNPPRTRHWFKVHAARLQPHTSVGWLALAAFLLYGLSGGLVASGALLALSTALVCLISVTLLTAGVFAGFAVGLVLFGLTGASVVAVCAANVAAAAYVWVSAALTVWRWVVAPFAGGAQGNDEALDRVLKEASKRKKPKVAKPAPAPQGEQLPHSGPSAAGVPPGGLPPALKPPVEPAVYPSDETVREAQALKASGQPISADELPPREPPPLDAGSGSKGDPSGAESDDTGSAASDHIAFGGGKGRLANGSATSRPQATSTAPPKQEVARPVPSYMEVPLEAKVMAAQQQQQQAQQAQQAQPSKQEPQAHQKQQEPQALQKQQEGQQAPQKQQPGQQGSQKQGQGQRGRRSSQGSANGGEKQAGVAPPQRGPEGAIPGFMLPGQGQGANGPRDGASVEGRGRAGSVGKA